MSIERESAWNWEDDFAPLTDDAEFYNDDLDAALADERAAVLENEIQQDEDPIDFEPSIMEDEDDPEAPISRDTFFSANGRVCGGTAG